MKINTQSLAAFFNVTPDRIKQQYASNAAGLRQLLAKAIKTGGKVNGYTADQLKQMAEDFEARSAGIKG